MREEVSGNACVIDEQIDIPMATLNSVNDGKETITIRDIALKRYQVTEFLWMGSHNTGNTESIWTGSAHYFLERLFALLRAGGR